MSNVAVVMQPDWKRVGQQRLGYKFVITSTFHYVHFTHLYATAILNPDYGDGDSDGDGDGDGDG